MSWNRLLAATTVVFVMAIVSNAIAWERKAPRDVPKYRAAYVSRPIKIDGKLDESAWKSAPAVGRFRFTWWKKGKKQPTIAKILWDDKNLYVGHVCADEYITARFSRHDDPVAKDDCFEIMLAPNPKKPDVYFNIEWNVRGAYIDGYRKNGPNKPSVTWAASGFRMAGTYQGTLNNHSDMDKSWTCEVAIPWKNFAGLVSIPPKPGSHWNVNLNRHGGDKNMQYSQWSSGDTPRPSFHTPRRFGRVTFTKSK